MHEIVYISVKGNPVTDSLMLAEFFGKQHSHVLRDIRNTINALESDELHSVHNWMQLYYATTYTDSSGKNNEKFVLSKNGARLLIMGWTGKKAMQFKIDYMNAFDQMEAQLKTSLQQKADFADKITASESTVDLKQAAKLLKLPYGRNTFIKKIREHSIFFNGTTEPKQQYINNGYFEFSEVPININGKTILKTKTTVTQKGLAYLQPILSAPKQLNIHQSIAS